MAINFREKFLEGLTDTACEIMKKVATGTQLTSNEIVFLKVYMRQLDAYEAVPTYKKVIDGLDKVSKFLKDNLSGLLEASSSGSEVDDYVINTNLKVEE